jgi:ATP-dependent DNA helicase PIF1
LTITQIPLKIAYAVTVHKTQGSTLDYIEIDMKNIFEYGQFYVAFSRARDLDKICIRNLNIDKIKAHPKAAEFYEKYI